jgi:hypothetical protein
MRDADREFEALEARLTAALAWEPSRRSLALLGARVAAVRRPRPGRPWLRPLVLLAAAVALMGAAITLTLVQQAAALIPGHKVAYDRGTVLNISRSVDGYSLVLERAYLDPNQLVLAFSAGTGGAGPAVPRANVIDSDGRHYLDFAGGDVTDETIGSGSVLAFDVPPGVTGTVHLAVSVPFLLTLRTDSPGITPDEPLTFAFDLTVQPSQTVMVEQTAVANGRSVTLRWLRFTGTAVRLRLDPDLAGLLGDAYPAWTLDATLRRPDRSTERLDWQALPPGWTGQSKQDLLGVIDSMDGSVTVYQARSGTDDPNGTWTVTVERLVGSDGRGGSTQVAGPWVFEVRVP